MRWLFALLLAPFLTLTLALSSSGNRLVVISEDAAEQKKFSKLFGDLKGELTKLLKYIGKCSRSANRPGIPALFRITEKRQACPIQTWRKRI